MRARLGRAWIDATEALPAVQIAAMGRADQAESSRKTAEETMGDRLTGLGIFQKRA